MWNQIGDQALSSLQYSPKFHNSFFSHKKKKKKKDQKKPKRRSFWTHWFFHRPISVLWFPVWNFFKILIWRVLHFWGFRIRQSREWSFWVWFVYHSEYWVSRFDWSQGVSRVGWVRSRLRCYKFFGYLFFFFFFFCAFDPIDELLESDCIRSIRILGKTMEMMISEYWVFGFRFSWTV